MYNFFKAFKNEDTRVFYYIRSIKRTDNGTGLVQMHLKLSHLKRF